MSDSDYAATYWVKGLTAEKKVALFAHPRLRNSVEVTDKWDEPGEYNIGLLYEGRVDDFLEWCEANGVEAELV